MVELINTIADRPISWRSTPYRAARAGEAVGLCGRSVRSEALAEQTAKATGEIGQQIGAIQGRREDGERHQEIAAPLKNCRRFRRLAAAVEEQGAATHEISRNVQQAAQGTQQVSVNISDVQRGASETGSASQVLSAAQSLSGDSNRLKLEVGKFLDSVRAA